MEHVAQAGIRYEAALVIIRRVLYARSYIQYIHTCMHTYIYIYIYYSDLQYIYIYIYSIYVCIDVYSVYYMFICRISIINVVQNGCFSYMISPRRSGRRRTKRAAARSAAMGSQQKSKCRCCVEQGMVDISIWGFPKMGWFIREKLIKMDDLGGTPILGNLHIVNRCE